MGDRVGKCVSMISRALVLDISLNMLQMSNDTTHLVGGFTCMSSIGLDMNSSISMLTVWYTKDAPPFTPMAKL